MIENNEIYGMVFIFGIIIIENNWDICIFLIILISKNRDLIFPHMIHCKEGVNYFVWNENKD